MFSIYVFKCNLTFRSVYKTVSKLMDQKPNVGSVAYLQENDRIIQFF